jgi:hypothetical protein
MNEQFLRLIAALAAPYPYGDGDPYLPSRFSRYQTDLLKAIWKMRKYPPALTFLATINHTEWPAETNDQRSLRAHRLAKEWLPVLLSEQQKLASENEMTKFKRQHAEIDPFIDEQTNLTRDSYSGQTPADDLDYTLDSRGNMVNK